LPDDIEFNPGGLAVVGLKKIVEHLFLMHLSAKKFMEPQDQDF